MPVISYICHKLCWWYWYANTIKMACILLLRYYHYLTQTPLSVNFYRKSDFMYDLLPYTLHRERKIINRLVIIDRCRSIEYFMHTISVIVLTVDRDI